MESDAPQETEGRLTRLARSGLRLATRGLQAVISRTLWWGSLGLMLGLIIAIGVRLEGLPVWAQWLVRVLDVIAVTAALGYAGFWRGVGRFVIYLGVSEGWVMTLLQGILDRTFRFFRHSSRVDRVLGRAELWAENLPLQQWEDGLKSSVAARLAVDEFADQPGLHRRFLRWLRRLCGRVIEYLLLRIVRQEVTATGGGGVSMARVRELALAMVDDLFIEVVEGAMNKALMVALLVPALAALLPVVMENWPAK